MEYANINEIRHISIDHTSNCNLKCPQCARTNNEILPIDELTLGDYKTFIEPIAGNLERILYCGNYGDPIVSNTFIPALTWLYNESGFKGHVHLVTNGSARDTVWWTNLAKLMGSKGSVAFSIDGLEDTNYLYRVDSNFKKIIENASAFINAGGYAEWEFLVFKHNEHQVDQVIELAKQMGFYNITIKQTNRFVSEKNLNNNSIKVDNKKGEYVIEMAEKHKGTGETQYKSIIDKHKDWKNYINNTHITCKTKAYNSIFIDYEAKVWACTWAAGGVYYDDPKDQQYIDARKILDIYGWNFNSLRHHSLADVLSHEYYANKICDSWKGTMDDHIPKLEVCGKICGSELEYSSGWTAGRSDSNKNNQKIKLK